MPLFLLKFLGKYWIEIVAAILIVAVLAYVNHKGYVRAEAKYKPLVAEQTLRADQAEADLKAERINLQKAQAASKAFQDEAQTLAAAAAAAPVPRVRCLVTRAGVPEATAPSGSNGAAPRDGPRTEDLGQDIGGQLYGLADSCDVAAARLRGLQTWAKSVSE